MKSKKKLLVAMAAMSVAAIGAGTVSTFAWFTATNRIELSKSATFNDSGVAVSAVEADTVTLGGLLKVAYKAANVNDVTGLAHFNDGATGTTSCEGTTASAVNLSTAYIDEGGHYHGLDGDGGKKLFAKFHLVITFETSTGWSSNNYTENGYTYTFSEVLTQLKANTLTVKVLESADSRMRIFSSTAATGDNYSDFSAGARTHTYNTLNTVNLSSELASVDGLTSGDHPLSEISIDVTGSLFYYVYGGAASDDEAEDERVPASFDVQITGAHS